jgi:hypothetical protein
MTIYISSGMTEMKNCCKCHKDKAHDEFKEGCKTCITCLTKVSEYQKNNPEKMREKCKRHYDKERDKILQQKREKLIDKVWCDCCKTEVRKDGWQDHIATDKHRHYKELEEGDEMRQEGKVWCETCRVLIGKKCFSKHKRSKEHFRLLNV